MSERWNILVVDDEPDVHSVTSLALSRASWRGKPFKITSAASAKEAIAQLSDPTRPIPHVAIVDVVMETDRAGLDLCAHMRAHCPRSMRIVLRTGQPGVAPEDDVLRDFDIDHYLTKTEATAERLYAILRASIYASLEIATLLEVRSLSKKLADALTQEHTTAALEQPLLASLDFLAAKHMADLLFVYRPDAPVRTGVAGADAKDAAHDAHAALLRALVLHPVESTPVVDGPAVGLGESSIMVLTPILLRRDREPSGGLAGVTAWARQLFRKREVLPVRAAVIASFKGKWTQRDRDDLVRDVRHLLDCWQAAYVLMSAEEELTELRTQRLAGQAT